MWLFLLILVKLLLLSIEASNAVRKSVIEFSTSQNSFMPQPIWGNENNIYGFIVSEDTVLMSESAYNKSHEIRFFKYLDDNNRASFSSWIPFPFGSFIKINEAAYIYKCNRSEFHQDRVIKINRYPVYGYTKNYLSLRQSGSFAFDTNIEILTDQNCTEIFPTFDPASQVCTKNGNTELQNSPLFANIENREYLIGLADTESVENGTIFNLISDKNYNLPTYKRCNYTSDLPSRFAICNSMEISRNLKETGHSEIVLIGNAEIENSESFLPLCLGTVVSNDQILVSSKITESLENYETYGNGKELKVAIMLDNTVIHDNQYLAIDSDVTFGGGKSLKLLKFNTPLFKDLPKAKFVFDKNFKSGDEKYNNEKISSIKFANDKMIIQKIDNAKNDQEISTMNPLFVNNAIIGFKEDNSYISAFELQTFLQEHVSNLQQEETTTPKATTTSTPPTTTTMRMTTTITTEFPNGTYSNDTEVEISGSTKFALTFWPLILAFFQLRLLL